MSSTRPCSANACPIAAMTAGSRPSETFGTDSRRATDLLYGARRCPTTSRQSSPPRADRTLRLDRAHSSAISPAAGAAAMRASRSSRRPSSTGRRAGGRISTGRRPASSREPRALRGAAGRAARCGVARARRGGVRRDVLLRLGDALLSRAACRAAATGRRRRPSGGSAHPGAPRSCGCSAPRSCSRSAASPPRAIVGARTLAECVGKSYLVDDAIVIPLPHPSGASAWLNDPVNRAPARQGPHPRPARDRAARRSLD